MTTCLDFEKARVSPKCSVNFLKVLVEDMKNKLDRKKLFKDTYFGFLLDFPLAEWMAPSQIMHCLMQRHVGDLKFDVQGTKIRFIELDFALIMGLKFGPLSIYGGGRAEAGSAEVGKGIRETNLRAGSVSKEKLKQAYLSLTDKDEHMDAVKLALIICVEDLLAGSPQKNNCVDKYIDIVDDLDYFNNYPWGSVGYDCLKNGVNAASDIIQGERVTSQYPKSYSICGCAFTLQIWAYKRFPQLIGDHKWAVRRLPRRIPRILNWVQKKTCRYEKISVIFTAVPVVLAPELRPTVEEAKTKVARSITAYDIHTLDKALWSAPTTETTEDDERNKAEADLTASLGNEKFN